MIRAGALLVALVASFGLACTRTGAEAGEDRFNDPRGFSESGLNKMACATCHETDPQPDPEVVRTGYSLYGTAARSSWWGGRSATLFDAANTCIEFFMFGDPLDPESDAGKQLYEYLLSITPDDAPSDPLPLTIVEQPVVPELAGDATRGAEVYRSHCRNCHGDTHTGASGFSHFILPEDMATYDDVLPGVPKDAILVEVIRHGRFFNVGGQMPFYAVELMSEQQIADLLAFLL